VTAAQRRETVDCAAMAERQAAPFQMRRAVQTALRFLRKEKGASRRPVSHDTDAIARRRAAPPRIT